MLRTYEIVITYRYSYFSTIHYYITIVSNLSFILVIIAYNPYSYFIIM